MQNPRISVQKTRKTNENSSKIQGKYKERPEKPALKAYRGGFGKKNLVFFGHFPNVDRGAGAHSPINFFYFFWSFFSKKT